MTVAERFTKFLANLQLTADQRADGITKHTGVRECLHENYYGWKSTADSFLVGSWGKSTEIRPPRDVDVMFVLPKAVYDRFQDRPGNKQSQLLQEVKSVLSKTYSGTEMRGDGQVVMVKFATYSVEIAPAFLLANGKYWICDTNDGGKYKETDPAAEIKSVKDANDSTAGNARDLIRMMKCWQGYCSVPLKSFLIELLVAEFIQNWEHKGKSSVYYDWMVRDFLKMLAAKSTYSCVIVPGTYEIIYLGDAWKSKAESARDRALKACDHEAAEMPYSAGSEWQKIFGDDILTG